MGGAGGPLALGKFVKKSFFVRPSIISFIHVQGWVPLSRATRIKYMYAY